MKKIIFTTLLTFGVSFSADLPPLLPPELGPFTGLETTVGYIQKENGEKFLIVETPDGTKLIKVKDLPQRNINPKDSK